MKKDSFTTKLNKIVLIILLAAIFLTFSVSCMIGEIVVAGIAMCIGEAKEVGCISKTDGSGQENTTQQKDATGGVTRPSERTPTTPEQSDKEVKPLDSDKTNITKGGADPGSTTNGGGHP